MSLKPEYARLRKIIKDCEGYTILVGSDTVQPGDETGFASTLLIGLEQWRVMDATFSFFFGKTVDELNDPLKNNELDARDRLFRRKVEFHGDPQD